MNKIGGLEAIGQVFGFEKFFGKFNLPFLSKIRWAYLSAFIIQNWCGETVLFALRYGGNVNIRAMI